MATILDTPSLPSYQKQASQRRTNIRTSINTRPKANEADNDRPSISETLSQLHYDKKKQNQSLRRLNSETHTISRRPIQHAPIASPFAGAGVEKVVYVSSKTPLMAAVKRVRKFLKQVEKREMQSVQLVSRGEREGMRRLAEAREKGKKEEVVVVKASGRAMAKAVAVGRWFEDKETEWQVSVQVSGGSVSTVDDVVEIDIDDEDDGDNGEKDDNYDENGEGQEGETAATTLLEGGDTTMELLGTVQEQTVSAPPAPTTAAETDTAMADKPVASTGHISDSVAPAKKKRKRTRKRKAFYDKDDVPEQRLRWIKTVEVAISFKP